MGLEPGTPLRDIAVDTVFIGSCTNSRIEDLRAAADVMKGRTVTVPRVMVVPGSHAVRTETIAEGLDQVFIAAGADWREPGCSMCLAMNPDKLAPGEHAASTSNRNFEGRQGRGGRTHLVSPAVAAATAVRRARSVRPPTWKGLRHEGRAGDHRYRGAVEALGCRHRPDHSCRLAQERVERTGFEKGLFSTWRDDRDFVLNDERYAQANILVAGPAFGVGSSPANTPSGPFSSTASRP